MTILTYLVEYVVCINGEERYHKEIVTSKQLRQMENDKRYKIISITPSERKL